MDWMLRVKQAQEAGDPTLVVSVCRQALGEQLTDQVRANVLVAYARALLAISPFWVATAVGALGSALELLQGDPESEGLVLAALSAVMVQIGQPDQAKEYILRYEALIKGHPQVKRHTGEIYHNYGVICDGAGRTGEAVGAYHRAVDSHRVNRSTGRKLGESLHNLALALISEGQLEAAEEAEQEAKVLLPDGYAGAQFRFFGGRLAAARGLVDLARQFYEEALAHSGCDQRTAVDIRLWWARLEAEAGNSAFAVQLARQAQRDALQLPYSEVLEPIDVVLRLVGGDGL